MCRATELPYYVSFFKKKEIIFFQQKTISSVAQQIQKYFKIFLENE
jgi:hypothetical protein